MAITRLVYTSSHSGISVNGIDDILQKSCINNFRDDITGALIVSNIGFMQLLEGSQKNVFKCLTKILRDCRHWNIQILVAGEAQERVLPGWSMYVTQVPEIKSNALYRKLVRGDLNSL